MQEYALLIVLGVVVVVIIGVGIWLRMKGFTSSALSGSNGAKDKAGAKNKAGAGKGANGADPSGKPPKNDGKDTFWKDGGLFSSKKKKGDDKEEYFKDEGGDAKQGGKLESWDDY